MRRNNWWTSIFDEAFRSVFEDDNPAPNEELTRARAERDAAQAHAARWRREVATLVGVQADSFADSELLHLLKAAVDTEKVSDASLEEEGEKVREVLRATGHSVTGPLHVDVDRAIDTERNRAQAFLDAVTRAVGEYDDEAATPSWPTEGDKVLKWVERDHRNAEPNQDVVDDRDILLGLLGDVLELFHASPWVREGYQAAVIETEQLDRFLARRAEFWQKADDLQDPPF